MTPNGNGHTQRDPISPGHDSADYKYGRFDASALHIAHALKQTEIQKSYNKCDKPINLYLVSVKIFAELMYSLAIAHQSKLEILKLSTCNLCSYDEECANYVYTMLPFSSPQPRLTRVMIMIGRKDGKCLPQNIKYPIKIETPT